MRASGTANHNLFPNLPTVVVERACMMIRVMYPAERLERFKP